MKPPASVGSWRSRCQHCLAAGSRCCLPGPPRGAGAQDGVEDDDELAHRGGERKLLRFAGVLTAPGKTGTPYEIDGLAGARYGPLTGLNTVNTWYHQQAAGCCGPG